MISNKQFVAAMAILGLILLFRVRENFPKSSTTRASKSTNSTKISKASANVSVLSKAEAATKRLQSPTGRYGQTIVPYGTVVRPTSQTTTWFEVTRKQSNDSGATVFNQTLPFNMFFIGDNDSDDNKPPPILYCPAAKVGTTTIKSTFEFDRCFANCPNRAHLRFWQNPQYQEAILHGRPLSFTHVRNPWDRIWSTYRGKIVTMNILLQTHKNRRQRNVPPTFVEFVQYVEHGHLYDNIHWAPFSHRCLTSPNANGQVFHYDHILRFEDDLTLGLQEIMNEANLSLTVEQHVFGNTEHSLAARKEFYTTEAQAANMSLETLVEKVYQLYRDDVDTFHYSFDKYN